MHTYNREARISSVSIDLITHGRRIVRAEWNGRDKIEGKIHGE